MKLLILSAKTGGGHEMRAKALEEISDALGFESLILRPLEDGPWIYRFGSNLYNWIQRFYPRTHRIYFEFLESASLHNRESNILGRKKILRVVRGFSPNIIISVHAHLNHGFKDLIFSNLSKLPKFFIFCGELADGVGFSKHWINPSADRFFGPFKETVDAAILRGMPEGKCAVLGPLLRRPFYLTPSVSSISKFLLKYGISDQQEMGVLATGANGVNNHVNAIASLSQSEFKGQIIALCGSNQSLISKIQKLPVTTNFKIIPLAHLNGNEMSILLYLSSWIYGRAGAGLSSEAIATNTPMIFDTSKGMMPQEENNLNFWRKNCQNLLISNSPNQLKYLYREIMPPFKEKYTVCSKKIIDEIFNFKFHS
jgi:processive 1,2-diacylglycerol beta-glucosyltransferase